MKKKIVTMLACVLVSSSLSACSGDTSTEATSEVSSESEVETSIVAESEEIEKSSAVSAVQDTSEETSVQTTLGYPADTIAEAIYGEPADYYTGESNGYTIDGYQKDGLRLFFIYESGIESEYPSLMLMDTINTTYGNDIYDNAENALSNLDFPEGVELISETFDNWGVDFLCNTNSDLITEFDPHWALLRPDQDYLENISYDDYTSMYKEGRYLDLWNSVEAYISENNPPSYDTAYEIEEKLEPLIEIWDQLEVSYDSVTDYATFYKSGITVISDSVHAVPHTVQYGRVEVTWGFHNSDWIFFDRIIITTTEDNVSYSTSSTTKDILEDASIMEYVDITLDIEDIDLFIGDESIIRFEGDDKKIDFILSSAEVEAMKEISTVASSTSFLCNYKLMYDRRFDEMYSAS